ncbi:MAG: sigma 54-interacting transcriptional regulator [Cyclobacteriaceae bacterium]|nr:sigma 54-interacting transcriptional regulator [Cyclobacteriaceae bacterium]
MPESSSSVIAHRLITQILSHTHHEFGVQYFRSLVKHLAQTLQVHGAWVTRYHPDKQMLSSLAFWLNDQYVESYDYALANTPCERVYQTKECFLVKDRVVELFPDDPDLKPMKAVSYLGYPMQDEAGEFVGHLAILHTSPLEPDATQEAIFNLFLQRANAEFIRMRTEEQLLEKKQRLEAFIGNTQDALLETDDLGMITLANPSACKLTGKSEGELIGKLAIPLFNDAGAQLLRKQLKKLRSEYETTGTKFTHADMCITEASGKEIPVEVSFGYYVLHNVKYLTLILRDVRELARAEQRIELLENEQHRLLPESGIIGKSAVMKETVDLARMVAASGSTVLLTGETGTGKEVFARFIHQNSPRAKHPLIKVNCAAIPENLIESEFFGHEKGAFTGALTAREGRFSLADGGTLFLDEIGELPLELQAKLLRVLQEGEFEPVGSSRTQKVDVRIVAATNRNLEEMVKSGSFREDLFYRLHVIPIRLPALRQRGQDVIELAEAIIRKLERRVGKPIYPLSESSKKILLHYSWPGNIRELEHVLERAVIFSKGGVLDLDGMLGVPSSISPSSTQMDGNSEKVWTYLEMDQLEKANIQKALALSKGKISGPTGAATILGIPPTTLHSRMKALGLK